MLSGAEWLHLIANKSCTVIGLGVSNLPLIDYLLRHGARISARDRRDRSALGEVAVDLERRGVSLVLGDGYLDDLCEEIIFRSPGVRPFTKEIEDAVRRGAILTSEMELFLALTPARVIAVTGSDGKTTTTTLTHLMIEQAFAKNDRRVYVGGNIGEPLLPYVDEMRAGDVAVLELSSFQLYTMRQSPHISALTNLSPNHLDWHSDMEDYVRAKTNIYRHGENIRAVFNAENEITVSLAREFDRPKTLFSSAKRTVEEFGTLLHKTDRAVYLRDGVIRLWNGEEELSYCSAEEILLPGKHNLENYMTAIALTDELATPEDVRAVARSFRGVAHRLELVDTVDGVAYYNSSIDTSPTRTAAALSAMKTKPIVICGGYDKHIPFSPLADALCKTAKAVILTGATAEKIEAALRASACTLPVFVVENFDNAVLQAAKIAKSGDVVLLSPACASFDAFPNFAARGERFRALVEVIKKGG